MPQNVENILTPLCTLIIGAFLSVLVIQPAGAAMTQKNLYSIKLCI